MTGGMAALIGAAFLGPRHGRFSGKKLVYPDYAPIFQALGTLILFMGWFGFNGVSTLAISGLSGVAGKTMAATAIAASAGCVSTVIIGRIFSGIVDYSLANNGILAGLVAITAACAVVELEGAFVIGVIAGFVYYGASKLLIKLEIDDVVDASPVHLCCGAWGVIAAGFFATQDDYGNAYYATYDNGEDRAKQCAGVFYGGDGSQLGANIVFVLVIVSYVGACSVLLFGTIKHTIGMRVDAVHEEMGLDKYHHSRSFFVASHTHGAPAPSKLGGDVQIPESVAEGDEDDKEIELSDTPKERPTAGAGGRPSTL